MRAIRPSFCRCWRRVCPTRHRPSSGESPRFVSSRQLYSRERRGRRLDDLAKAGSQFADAFEKAGMGHARADVGPAIRLVLDLQERVSLDLRERAAGGQLQRIEIELRLLGQA